MDPSPPNPWRLSVAPMMDWTDRHCRYFHRLLAPHARLYTEMVTSAALVRGERVDLIGFDPAEHPVALQLGGADPDELAAAARLGAAVGYDEINLNVGCPSDRVQCGRFGACLMREPGRVADCVRAMRAAVDVPVTVKCRIGVDDQDEDRDLSLFAAAMVEAGVRVLIVHARKAWLQGLSPRENREIPPINYPRVYRLKREFPQLTVVINGGIGDAGAVREHLLHVDGVMLGRLACHDPWQLALIDAALFNGVPPERRVVFERMRPYIEAARGRNTRLAALVRPALGLFHGLRGGKAFRRELSERMQSPDAGWEAVEAALLRVEAPAGLRVPIAPQDLAAPVFSTNSMARTMISTRGIARTESDGHEIPGAFGSSGRRAGRVGGGRVCAKTAAFFGAGAASEQPGAGGAAGPAPHRRAYSRS